MIQRLAKGVLPANTQIQKDALLALCKSATVFVGYLANSANDRAVLANKKTVRPEDVLEALAELEFEGFVGRCERELSSEFLFISIYTTFRRPDVYAGVVGLRHWDSAAWEGRIRD